MSEEKEDIKQEDQTPSERKKVLQVTLRDQQKITIADNDRDLLVSESEGMIVIYRKSDESATKQVAYIAKDQVLCIVWGTIEAKPTEDSPA
ncbi:hypothetical protein [Zymobacter sp. IVIA_12111.31 C1]|uniref:hypothetical protein n=1 Tax=Zymobacter sp. IVIA_12111.31 C1 TaxID=3394854 RepID=UPI0039C4E1BB